VKKNTTLNNLISKYLEKHPDKKRPPSEIEELERLNKITNDIVEVLDKKQPEQHPQSLFGFPNLVPFPQSALPLPQPSNSFLYNSALNIGSFLAPTFSQAPFPGNICTITS